MIKNKYFLYATAFFSGMSIMAIELGASRLLAPYFSSSQIVWTVIIGTIMIAMAVGNVWGGRAADKNPDPVFLYKRLLFVAVWTAAIPFLGKLLIAGVSLGLALFVKQNFLVWASFASCILLFVFPLMMLGTVTPSLMKYATSSLEDNGKTVGELEALGTIGSIIGTFLPTFVTIPAVGTAMTFLIFALILSILALVFFITGSRTPVVRTVGVKNSNPVTITSNTSKNIQENTATDTITQNATVKRRVKKYLIISAAVTVIIIILMFLPNKNSFAFWNRGLAYEGESIYNYLQVEEDEKKVILSTNVMMGVQSIRIKDGGLTGMYYDCALAAPLMAEQEPEAQEVLILGLGTGTYANQCLTYYPGIQMEGVEIDSKIVDLAYEYFELSDDTRVHVEDGRCFLMNAGTYDVIMVDAYQDITIPFQMSTVEFFTEVKNHLNPGGVMVVNMNMRSEKEDAINDYLCDTIASVFDYTTTVTVYSGTNTELFAGSSPEMIDNLTRRIEALPEGDLKRQVSWVKEHLEVKPRGMRILTDDQAPVELLGMKVLDEMIGNELDYYKDLLLSGDFDTFFSE